MGQRCSYATSIDSPTPPTVHIDTAPIQIHVHRASPRPVQFVITPQWSERLQHATALHPTSPYPYLELQFHVTQGAIHHLELSIIKIDSSIATKHTELLKHYQPPTIAELCTTSVDHRLFTLKLNSHNTCQWCPGTYQLSIVGNLQYISIVNAYCKSYLSADGSVPVASPPPPTTITATPPADDLLQQLQALNDSLQQQLAEQQQTIALLQDQLQECQQELVVKDREITELELHSGMTAAEKQQLELRYKAEIDAVHMQHHHLQNSSTDNAAVMLELEAHNAELAKRTQELVTTVNAQKRKRAELLIATWRFRALQPVYQQWRHTAHTARLHKQQLLEKYVDRLAHAELYRAWRQWHGFSKVTAVKDIESRFQQQIDTMNSQLLEIEASELTLKQQLMGEKRKRAMSMIELLRGRSQQSCFHAWHKYTLEEKIRKRNLLNRAVSHMINLPLYSAWRQWQSFTHSVNRQALQNSGKATATQQRCAVLEVRLAEQDKLLTEARQASYAARLELTVQDKKCVKHRRVLDLFIPLFQQLRYNTLPNITDQLKPFCNVGCDCRECITKAKATFALVVQLTRHCEQDTDLRQMLEGSSSYKDDYNENKRPGTVKLSTKSNAWAETKSAMPQPHRSKAKSLSVNKQRPSSSSQTRPNTGAMSKQSPSANETARSAFEV